MLTFARCLTSVLACGLLACSAERKPGELFGSAESDVLVIDAQLLVGQPMPAIFLRRTADPRESYDLRMQGVIDADITIRSADGLTRYTADPDSAGRYLPGGTAPVVVPLTEYELVATVGQERLSARTRTPGPLRIREVVVLDEQSLQVRRKLVLFAESADAFAAAANQVVYLDGLLETRLDTAAGAAGYQLSLASLDLASDFVIDADFLEQDDYDDFERQGSSPVIDGAEGNVRVPWFAVAFAGRHIWRTYALDQNWYDFARTDPETGGGGFGQLAGDAFQRPHFAVQGGIGLFGSAAVDSVGFVVLPAPGNQD
ncbi:MAG: hypothetical protein O2782_07175 [bacterium]|nr:hypothetical protein [bacterium]